MIVCEISKASFLNYSPRVIVVCDHSCKASGADEKQQEADDGPSTILIDPKLQIFA